eukprot:1161504-Pelagomonas_calceolata.AAC.8
MHCKFTCTQNPQPPAHPSAAQAALAVSSKLQGLPLECTHLQLNTLLTSFVHQPNTPQCQAEKLTQPELCCPGSAHLQAALGVHTKPQGLQLDLSNTEAAAGATGEGAWSSTGHDQTEGFPGGEQAGHKRRRGGHA